MTVVVVVVLAACVYNTRSGVRGGCVPACELELTVTCTCVSVLSLLQAMLQQLMQSGGLQQLMGGARMG